jgi:hypothetical protein
MLFLQADPLSPPPVHFAFPQPRGPPNNKGMPNLPCIRGPSRISLNSRIRVSRLGPRSARGSAFRPLIKGIREPACPGNPSLPLPSLRPAILSPSPLGTVRHAAGFLPFSGCQPIETRVFTFLAKPLVIRAYLRLFLENLPSDCAPLHSILAAPPPPPPTVSLSLSFSRNPIYPSPSFSLSLSLQLRLTLTGTRRGLFIGTDWNVRILADL